MDPAQEDPRAIFQPNWHGQEDAIAKDDHLDCLMPALTLRWPMDKSLVKETHLHLNANRALQSRLDELYFDQGMPLRLVKDIAWRLYRYRAPEHRYKEGKTSFRKRGLRKNKTVSKPKRYRPGAILKPKNLMVPFHVILSEIFTMSPALPTPVALKRYRIQEKILYCLDCYIYSIFDPKGGKWKASSLGFVNSGVSNLNNWQFLSDQTYGASTLINCREPKKALRTLDDCFRSLAVVARQQDPSLMVKFWRICLSMHGIDGRGRQFNALRGLFDVLQKAFSEKFGPTSSLSILVQSLRKVPLHDFKETLRVGFDKTIRTVSSLVGDENAMILHMWSHYFKYWDRQYLARDTFLLKLDLLWHRIHNSSDSLSESAITITYYYTYAVYYLGDMPLYSEWMMRDLFHLTTKFLQLQSEIRWSLPTLAFAFSAKSLATIDRGKGRNDLCISAMAFAIGILADIGRALRVRVRATTLAKPAGLGRISQTRYKECSTA